MSFSLLPDGGDAAAEEEEEDAVKPSNTFLILNFFILPPAKAKRMQNVHEQERALTEGGGDSHTSALLLMSHMSGSVVIPSRARANVIIPRSFPKQGRRIEMSLLFHLNRVADSVIQLDLANLAVFRSLPSAGSPHC